MKSTDVAQPTTPLVWGITLLVVGQVSFVLGVVYVVGAAIQLVGLVALVVGIAGLSRNVTLAAQVAERALRRQVDEELRARTDEVPRS